MNYADTLCPVAPTIATGYSKATKAGTGHPASFGDSAVLDKLRTPLFIIALIVLLLTVLIEIGSVAWIGAKTTNQYDLPTPGLGIPYLALLDGLLLFTLILMALSLILPARIHGRVQGIATLIVSLSVLIGAIVLIFVAIGLLVMMVTLLLAIPFGTIAYMAAFAHFSVGAAQGTMGSIMLLKIVFIILLVLAQQRFIQNKGLVLLTLTSLIGNIVVNLMHSLFPRPLVSITDDIGAIIVGILAAIWAVVLLIGAIPAIIKALRVDRALAG